MLGKINLLLQTVANLNFSEISKFHLSNDELYHKQELTKKFHLSSHYTFIKHLSGPFASIIDENKDRLKM